MDLRAVARRLFYPEKLPAKRELEHASRQLTAIEINGTFYRSQGPKSFGKWHDETPEDFVFSVKGHRAVVNAKKLGEAGGAVEWFFKSGICGAEGEARAGALATRAVQEVRRGGSRRLPRAPAAGARRAAASPCDRGAAARAFSCRNSSTLARAAWRRHRLSPIPITHPAIADVTADFVYLRLQRSDADVEDRISGGGARSMGSARQDLGGGRRTR